MSKILLTGATGLIGSALIEQLANFFEVHAISRTKAINSIKNVNWYYFDLNESINFNLLPSKIETIIYLAQSENYRDFPKKALDIFEINTVKLLKMLDYARTIGVKKFIFASSGGVYGAGQNVFFEKKNVTATGKIGFYLSSKLCSEIISENYKQFMDLVILRMFFVYGKMQKSNMLIPRLVANIKNKNPINLQGNDGILLNPTHVSDAVSSILSALELNGFHKINVAGPEVVSLKQICEIISKKIEIKPIFNYDLQNTPKHIIGDISNMKRLLKAPLCSLDEGLDEMIF